MPLKIKSSDGPSKNNICCSVLFGKCAVRLMDHMAQFASNKYKMKTETTYESWNGTAL